MINNWLPDTLLKETPKRTESERLQYVNSDRLLERQRILKAVQPDNLFMDSLSLGKYKEGKHSRHRIILYLKTRRGITGKVATLGKLEFTLHKNVNLADVFVRAKKEGLPISGYLDKLLHFNIISINSKYRKHDYQHTCYLIFSTYMNSIIMTIR